MDGEQPFLARDDDKRLVFFSFTALLDVIKNVGWMVCVHLNECWRIAFPFRYVADNLPVMLLPQIQPKIASRSVPLSRKSKSLQRSVQSLNSQRTLESSRPFPMLLMQQTRVIYLIYHRNCPKKVFSDPLFSKSWPLSSVVLLTKKSLCFFSLLHSTLESTTINHDRAMFLPELMNRANYIGTVFQNHHKYHISITENILVGSVGIVILKIDLARFARNVGKWDFLSYFQIHCMYMADGRNSGSQHLMRGTDVKAK